MCEFKNSTYKPIKFCYMGSRYLVLLLAYLPRVQTMFQARGRVCTGSAVWGCCTCMRFLAFRNTWALRTVQHGLYNVVGTHKLACFRIEHHVGSYSSLISDSQCKPKVQTQPHLFMRPKPKQLLFLLPFVSQELPLQLSPHASPIDKGTKECQNRSNPSPEKVTTVKYLYSDCWIADVSDLTLGAIVPSTSKAAVVNLNKKSEQVVMRLGAVRLDLCVLLAAYWGLV